MPANFRIVGYTGSALELTVYPISGQSQVVAYMFGGAGGGSTGGSGGGSTGGGGGGNMEAALEEPLPGEGEAGAEEVNAEEPELEL